MNLLQVYKKMLSFYGRQNWWPVTDAGELSPTYKPRKRLAENQKFEVAIGAILAQNTNWKNVEKAIVNLNKAEMLDCKKIANAKQKALAELIRPSGYYNQKAKKLVLFAKYLQKNYSCKVEKLFEKQARELRAELLSLHGIGNETADSIILYAAGKPVFVVDAYTKRLLQNFFAFQKTSYGEAQNFFEFQLPSDLDIFKEFHALIVEHAKRFCRKKPDCKECFLNNICQFFLSEKNAQN
jgi:endonuclease-3 related protein